ncbi:DUF4279 domain-containing protein [Singulisphaera rosea]
MSDDESEMSVETFATFRVYPGEMDPSMITDRLRLQPSSWQRQGELVFSSRRPPRPAPINGWFLTSRDQVDSRDSRPHIDWLLDRLTPKAEAVRALQDEGCKMDISCFWLSKLGNGGPELPPAQMRRLADLNIMLWFDFYGPFDDNNDDETKE